MSSFYTTLTGLDAFHTQISAISNNMANVETTAFKSNDTSFAEVLTSTMSLNSASSAVAGKGVSIQGTTTSWDQGDLVSTGNTNDLAITGEGFFVVSDTTGGTGTYYTRDGNFRYDVPTGTTTATLLNSYGMAVQGNSLTGGGGVADITIDTATYVSTSIDAKGIVSGTDAAGIVTQLYQIELAQVPNKDGLDKVKDNLYVATGTSGTPATGYAGTGNFANDSITSGSLEISNVDMAAQMADLVIAQRAYEACAKLMTAESEIMKTTVQMT